MILLFAYQLYILIYICIYLKWKIRLSLDIYIILIDFILSYRIDFVHSNMCKFEYVSKNKIILDGIEITLEFLRMVRTDVYTKYGGKMSCKHGVAL